MAFKVGEIVSTLSLKKKVSITIPSTFLLNLYRTKIDDTWGRRLIIIACPFGHKMWWI